MRQTEKNNGFSLIEVIVGMLMLTIVIVSVLTAFTASAKNNVRAKKEQSAENLAVNLMEYARAGGEEFSVVFGGTEEVPETTETVRLSNVPEGFFSYDVVVEKTYDAVEYDKDLLNAYETIRPGTEDMQTVFVDLGMNGISYDNSVVRLFLETHKLYMEELIGASLAEPDEVLTEPQLRQRMTRELVISTESIDSRKMQLVAELVYEVANTVKLPEDMERKITREVCRSIAFDRGDISFGDTKKIEQIFVLFTPYQGKKGSADIRILDSAKVLNSKLFLVWQETTDEALNDELYEKTLATRTGGAKVDISYTSREGIPADPYRLELYSAVDFDAEYSPNVVSHRYSLVPTGSGKRIASVLVQVKDPDSGAVLVELSGAYTE